MGITIFVPFVVFPYALITGNPASLILCGVLILIHALLVYLRRRGFVFGGLFGLTLMLVSASLSLFYRDQRSLIVLPFLFTLGVVVLYKRLKSNKVRMKGTMPNDLLKNIKEMLTKKDKQLAKEESILDKNDPYKVSGRDEGNSEFEEEAMEDQGHTTTQLLKASVFDMRTQVRKALAKINIGTYGICEVCHKPIDSARLKAFPQATTCLSCAEKKER
jgi:RNA polymerase-binding transcription factor DksA